MGGKPTRSLESGFINKTQLKFPPSK